MPLDDIIARPITGIRPFNELPIDAEVWRQAHYHHHHHRYVHALSAHRPGIVVGLEVAASQSRERTVVVSPGIAIDGEGQTLVVSEPVAFVIEEARQVYITLSFLRAVDRSSAITVGGGQQHYREVEGRELKATKDQPQSAYLELARIFRSGADKPIRDAANPFMPGVDELNLLYRSAAFPQCWADCGVGELAYVPRHADAPWNPNRAGLWNLLRHGNTQNFHLDFTGPINLTAPPGGGREPVLLYIAGRQAFQPFAQAEVDGLRAFLDRGGVLFGEALNEGEEFTQAFQELSRQLGANVQPLPAGHALLSAHYVFAEAPGGRHEPGALLLDDNAGVVFSACDYGGAWQGGVEGASSNASRTRIHQAQEWGLNIVAWASRRVRAKRLSPWL